MNTEQAIADFEEWLDDNRDPVNTYTPEKLEELKFVIFGDPFYNSYQYDFVSRWFLESTEQQKEDLELLWPPNMRFTPRIFQGRYMFSVDLLSEIYPPHGMLQSSHDIYASMPFVKILPNEWPAPPTEE